MELSLYCPNFGYYEVEKDSIGRKGDFFTSVSVGSVFGELLAWQFAQWLLEIESVGEKLRNKPGAEAGRNEALSIIEAGAHEGKLAKDILSWFSVESRSLYDRIQYRIIEPSVRRQSWQQQELAEFGEKVEWVTSLDALGVSSGGDSRGGIDGIIFSNELLDSFPVHRYGWDANNSEWFEWGVTVAKERFVWTRLTNSRPEFVPNNRDTEFHYSPAAESWWRDGAQSLRCGKLLTFDYAFLDTEAAKAGKQETLRAYRKHQLSTDVLADPGEQDLTAHVNFSRILQAGENVGLRTEAVETQERFLTNLFARAWSDEAVCSKWTSGKSRQLQTLVHPEHLGKRFHVLVQSRGCNKPEMAQPHWGR